MCSCFCDTFCCCFSRFRASSARGTPTFSSSSRNKSKDVEHHGEGQKEGTISSDGQGTTIEDTQPAPRLPMPQLGGVLGDPNTYTRESSSRPSDVHSEDQPHNPGSLSPRPRASPLSSIFAKAHTRRRSHDPPPPSQIPQQSTPRAASIQTGGVSGMSTPRAADQPTVSPQMLDEARARSPTAVLSSFDDMPSASDFLVASAMPDFDNDVELEVPPQGQIPELEGGDSTQAWREEERPKPVETAAAKENEKE